MSPLLGVSLLLAAPQAVSVSYDQFAGLRVDVAGVRVVVGSAFQYYEPDWAGGIYGSRWQPKTVVTTGDTIAVRYQGRGNGVLGTITYKVEGDTLTARYEFGWTGNREVRIENCFGLLWAPAFKDAHAVSSNLRRSRFADVPFAEDSMLTRALAVDVRSIAFDAPFGRVSLESDGPFIVFDGRNYPQDWARGRPVHWAGALEHAIKPGGRVAYTVRWKFSSTAERPLFTESVSGLAARVDQAHVPQDPLPLVPKPMSHVPRNGDLETRGVFRFVGLPDDLRQKCEARANGTVAARWEGEGGEPTIVTVGRTTSATPGAYTIDVTEHGCSIYGADDAGFLNAAGRLAQLVRTDGARLVIPRGTLRDHPKLNWRGVHMFVGPRALAFQTRLIERVLVPLLFDHVVLQCERTAWESLPGTETPITMKRDDLARLFDTYRGNGIEPVPLIQSLGHMEWLFANKQNLDLAINPEIAYTIDPRKQRSKEVVEALWNEAITLLKPKAVHFGLDEIDMRGMPDDQYLATRLWKHQVPILLDIAKRHNVTPMLWGDMMLAPREAIDATHGRDDATAQDRRSVLRPGTVVTDWHYANDPNTKGFQKSLDLWKSLGMKPIAAGWHRPNNVYAFTKAAANTGAGYLQTTWAGYESNEFNMARELHQLAAYVLAAEYAWGWQDVKPSALPYDPADLARRMLFDAPQPVRAQDGLSLLVNAGPENVIGGFRFRGERLFELRSTISAKSKDSPTGILVSVNRPARRVAVAADCFAWMDVGQQVATIVVHMADGRTVRKDVAYGIDVRASDDPNPTSGARVKGMSVVVIDLAASPETVRSIEFQRSDPVAGLRVHGITLT